MSIVELLQTVDTLAQLINQKNKELEKLKLNYDAKLKQINQYISLFSTDDQPIEDKKLLDIINTPVKCNNCDHVVWDITQDTHYIIIPKNSIKYLQSDALKTLPAKEPFQYQPPKSTPNSKKKTCSYCNKTGHSRARCFKRLNTELNKTT